jgi:transketolase
VKIDGEFVSLAVRKMPQSGKPDELLTYVEIDTKAIVQAVV